MKKIRVKSYSDVCIGEYPFHKELKDELVPLLENYPDKQGRKTNVIATMTEWDWNPENDRLNRLKNNLGKIGLALGGPIPTMEGKSGSFSIPLTLFGGRFGKDTDTPIDEFLNDDGISHMVEGGLALKIQYEMLGNSSCRIFAEIV